MNIHIYNEDRCSLVLGPNLGRYVDIELFAAPAIQIQSSSATHRCQALAFQVKSR